MVAKFRSNEMLRLWLSSFRDGVFPGAVAGTVAGLVPGVLLILVLTGDTYHISGSEVLGFIVMCVAAGALLGAFIGGCIAGIIGGVRRRLRRS
ncbi:MAG: hypothetical protein F4X66_12325 [Chloroflexi bacterium]|nr:hypothetical protein [Chloroflexota bacterium]MYE38811.1 hypothetical protein [Chloroflexota bacterium]